MPRPNKVRSVGREDLVRQRVMALMRARGWNYESLAKRMTDSGCSIAPSALFKIEKADPPRRITVDELVAFADVFAVPVEELTADPVDEATRQAEAASREFVLAWRLYQSAKVRQDDAEAAIDQARRATALSAAEVLEALAACSLAIADGMRIPNAEPAWWGFRVDDEVVAFLEEHAPAVVDIPGITIARGEPDAPFGSIVRQKGAK